MLSNIYTKSSVSSSVLFYVKSILPCTKQSTDWVWGRPHITFPHPSLAAALANDPSQISRFSSPSPYRNDCIFFPTLSDPSWFGSTPNFCPYYRLWKFLSLFPALQGEYITCTWLPRIRHISTCQDWSQARGGAWKINSTALCPEQLASKEGESVAKTYSSK